MVINGPNLNMLKYRETSIYGKVSIDEINGLMQKENKNIRFNFVQTNYEGKIIDYIHEAIINEYDAIIINAGAYSHYSYAIYDALLMFKNIKIEVHLSNIDKRDKFRQKLVTASACDEIIKGKGFKGYLEAIDRIILLKGEK